MNAVDKKGMYQYLVEDTAYHTMNGPRLTNATYAGVTVDTNIAVSRTVSTWTAGKSFFPRLLFRFAATVTAVVFAPILCVAHPQASLSSLLFISTQQQTTLSVTCTVFSTTF